MSEENVSAREFERWVQLQSDTQNKHSEQLKEISKEINKTNQLLRKDIASTKNLLEAHINQYNHDKERNSETFRAGNERMGAMEKVIQERAGVYNIASKIKWVLVIITTGALAAFGKDIVDLIIK